VNVVLNLPEPITDSYNNSPLLKTVYPTKEINDIIVNKHLPQIEQLVNGPDGLKIITNVGLHRTEGYHNKYRFDNIRGYYLKDPHRRFNSILNQLNKIKELYGPKNQYDVNRIYKFSYKFYYY